jgi:hypothetical protein
MSDLQPANESTDSGMSGLKAAVRPPTPRPRRSSTRRRAVVTCSIAVAAAVAAVLIVRLIDSGGETADAGEVLPADASNPPVLIEHVTPLSNETYINSFVLPAAIDMDDAGLREFNEAVFPVTEQFQAWYTENHAAGIDKAATSVSLRGNADETVRIADIDIDKSCTEPFQGTFFSGYTQGSGDTIGIGFDLDLADPIPFEMARSNARGIYPLEHNYFTEHEITLAPRETLTLSLGVWSETYSCEFTFRLIVATSTGSYWQKIDYLGEPFVLTAFSPATAAAHPFSGYEAAYVHEMGLEWIAVDPATYGE